jgi:CubicO group peptidase (beta-lactamase class C family)
MVNEEVILNKIERALRGVASSLAVAVYQVGKERLVGAVGEPYRLYDWASLTKIVFTTSLAMKAVGEGKLNLDDPLQSHLSWWKTKETQVAQLLNHTAGLTWWKRYYEMLDEKSNRVERWSQLQRLIAKEVPKTGAKSIYSDLDFFVMGFLMEKLYDKPLLELAKEILAELGLKETHFVVDNEPPQDRKVYAPTERCKWRKRTLQGEVHDDNTWMLGGVAPHAGLFGPLKDLMRYGLTLRATLVDGRSFGSIRADVVRQFCRRSIPPEVGDFALGFMMPTKAGSSCGPRFSEESIGHTGFTGTSLWFDPAQDLLIGILSNRTYPSRDNERFKALRPQIHTWIVQWLNGELI